MASKRWRAATLIPAAFFLVFAASAQAQSGGNITFSPSANVTDAVVASARLSYWCPADAQNVVYHTWPNIIYIYTFGICVATPPPGGNYTQPSISFGRLTPGSYGVFWEQYATPENPFNTGLGSGSLNVTAAPAVAVAAPALGALAASLSMILLLLSGGIALKKGR